MLELPVEPLLPPEPTEPLVLEPMPVLAPGVEDGLVVLELEPLPRLPEPDVLLEPVPDVLLPVLEPCCFRQSCFAIPLRLSQREPDGLVVLLMPLGLLELGLELEPLLELGLVVLELLEPVVLLGLEVDEPGLLLLELCAIDTVANPASAAAMAMPSAFFIIGCSSGVGGRCCGAKAASAVPRRSFMV